jgi:hypothetical protein
MPHVTLRSALGSPRLPLGGGGRVCLPREVFGSTAPLMIPSDPHIKAGFAGSAVVTAGTFIVVGIVEDGLSSLAYVVPFILLVLFLSGLVLRKQEGKQEGKQGSTEALSIERALPPLLAVMTVASVVGFVVGERAVGLRGLAAVLLVAICAAIAHALGRRAA